MTERVTALRVTALPVTERVTALRVTERVTALRVTERADDAAHCARLSGRALASHERSF